MFELFILLIFHKLEKVSSLTKTQPQTMSKRVLKFLLPVAGLILGYTGLRLIVFFYTDWLWFQNLGYGSVLVTTALARLLALVAFGTTFAVMAAVNICIARKYGRHTREMPLEVIIADVEPVLPERRKRQLLLWSGTIALLTGAVGLIGAAAWMPLLRYFYPIPFGFTDPVFDNDLSFYFFSLPAYNFVQGWLAFAVILTIILVSFSYHQDRALRKEKRGWSSTPFVRGHLSVLTAILAFVCAWWYWLKEYEILYSFRKDAFFGAGYTDVHVQIFAYRLMMVLSILLGALLMYNLRDRKWWPIAYGGSAYFSAILLLSWLFPILFEQFVVKPDELRLEEPYIRRTIEHTQRAYGLDRIEEAPFPAEADLDFEDIRNNLATIRNIPLWDRRPLIATYSQLQEIRSYYRFGSIDVDRYSINGEYQQVMLAAREFSRDQLAIQGETWVNRHLVYTHGYGFCMSPASKVDEEGLPEFYVKDIPPSPSVDIQVGRPEIYYGEAKQDYVIVNTRTEEFDYPRGDENAYTTYRGTGGVPVNTFLRRLLFALRFGDPYLLFTKNLKPESRIQFDRHIGRRFRDEGPKRFQKLAPYLRFDKDPYLVTVNGRLVWVQDAYTESNMYPYAEPYGRPYVREANYIRNAVKATLDAYDGTVTFYVWDPDDPLVRSYMEIFPDLYRSKEDMPEALRAHVRYPVDLFEIQASLYNTYHMASPQVFYNREDVWEPATEIYGVSERPRVMAPYYIIVKLPDAEREEFVLMLPATPAGKANMIAWLLARCDGPNYGRLMVYKLPKKKLIYGPMLIERRIDQNTDISREITLWSQRGSDVLRGNLLVVPIEKGFIYVEPLYLRATQSGMPELKRVLVAHGDRLAMAEDLEEALNLAFESHGTVPDLGHHPALTTAGFRILSQTALTQFDTAQSRLRKGDFAGYGEAVESLRKTLQQLRKKAETEGN